VSTVVIFATGISPQIIAQPQAEVFEEDVGVEVQTALSASHQDGSLQETVLSWNPDANGSDGAFDDGTTTNIQGGAYLNHPDTEFGDRLRAIEDSYGVNINVRLIPMDGGEPAELIITTSGGGDRNVERKTIIIHEDDRLGLPAKAYSTQPTAIEPLDDGDTVEGSNYPIDNEGSNNIYNTVTVEVVIYDV